MRIYRLINEPIEKAHLLKYLQIIDSDFTPTLSTKVCLSDFVNKILEEGYVYVMLEKGNIIVGVICFYANDLLEKKAYASLLHTHRLFRKQGISKSLLKTFLEKSYSCGMDMCELHTNSAIALSMYLSMNFKIINRDGNIPPRYHLRKKIR